MMQEGQKAQPDQTVNYSHWAEALAASGLEESVRLGHAVTLRWYLSFCRRHPVPASFESARDFIAAVQRERQPPAAQLERWKEAIRWFFRHANPPAQGPAERHDKAGPESRRSWPDASPELAAATAWQSALRRMLRVRHYWYRTEQS